MRRWFVAFSGVLILSAGLARAEGGYAGASVGRTSLEETNGRFTFRGTDSGAKAFAGYRLHDFLAVEGSYFDLGTPGDTVSGFRRRTSISGLDFFAVGVLPLRRFELFAKAGLMAWTKESTTSGNVPSSTANDGGVGVTYGAGGEVRCSQRLWLRAEWEAFDVRGTDRVDLVSLGFDWSF